MMLSSLTSEVRKCLDPSVRPDTVVVVMLFKSEYELQLSRPENPIHSAINHKLIPK
jgi:hypothetical protein